MRWNAIPGIACLLSLLFPVVTIIYNRYVAHRSLAALLIYYIFLALSLAMFEGIIPVPAQVSDNFNILAAYLNVPLMLTALLFFCPNRQKQRFVHIMNACFISYEIIITIVFGFNPHAVVYILGPGIPVILFYTIYLFVRQVKFTIMHGKNHGRTLMLTSILFAFSCYELIFYFYYIQKTPYTDDALLLLFISTFVASVIMGLGLHLMRKRMKELKSLKITRRELALFFSAESESKKFIIKNGL
jgi:hypothetical protein